MRPGIRRFWGVDVLTFTGPTTVHIHVHGATAADIRRIVTEQLTATLAPIGAKLSEISDYLDATGATVDTIQSALTDVAADVTALLNTAGEAGVFTDDERAKAEAVSGKLAAINEALGTLDTAVGDQDGSDTPVEPAV